jgi:hypothetical protein
MVRLQIGLVTTSHAGRKPGHVTQRVTHRDTLHQPVQAIKATFAGTKSSQTRRTT